MKTSKMLNRYCKAIIALFILAVIPMVIISFYNHPSADDFSALSLKTWQQSHSLFAVMKVAVEACIHSWHNWSGLYTGCFFGTLLQPAMYGEQYYCIVGILMIANIILSNVIVSYYFFHGVLGGGRLEAACIAAMMSFAMLEWMPRPVEALYWWSGAICYVPFQVSLMAIVCLMIEIFRSFGKQGTRRKITLMSIAIGILAVYHGGGNQMCSFAGALVMCVFLATAIAMKDKKRIALTAVLFCAVIAFFLLNVLAPGGKLRMNVINNAPGVLCAMYMAIGEGMGDITRWTKWRIVILMLLSLPVAVPATVKFCKRTAFSFRLPALVLAASIAWICALYCPNRYAEGWGGSGRIKDYVYYSYIVLLFFNEVYLIGFLYKSGIAAAVRNEVKEIKSKIMSTAASVVVGNAVKVARFRATWEVAGIVIVLIIVAMGGFPGLMGTMDGLFRTTSTTRAIGSVFINKSAQQYDKEYYERIRIYEAHKGEDVAVKSFSVRPGLLYFDDITDDPLNWRNGLLASYYGLKSVRIENEGSKEK